MWVAVYGRKYMRNITIEMSEEELKHVWQTYQTLQLFKEKTMNTPDKDKNP
jgi:hypothetical protein